MTTCKINFFGESKALAEGIYADLQKQGVRCKELDGGYQVTNYAGIHCSDKSAKSCMKGVGDGVVEAEEVLEYAFNNYEKYREILEGRLGTKLPWLLDDFDPKTDFDAKIRAQVQSAIIEVKRILGAKGLKEGTPEYQEKLAVGLLWFVAFPKAGKMVIVKTLSIVQQRMMSDGFGELFQYLIKNGGMRLDTDYSAERTVLDAQNNDKGKCTEMSKTLFAVLKMAGISSFFIQEDIRKERHLDAFVKEMVSNYPSYMGHACIGIPVLGKMRILDPSLISSNAHYDHYNPMTPRQFMGTIYFDYGVYYSQEGKFQESIAEYIKALQFDHYAIDIIVNRGVIWQKMGDIEKAIADYKRALEINPQYVVAYHNLATLFAEKGDLDSALENCQKAVHFDSGSADVHLTCGNIWSDKGDWKKAIEFYDTAIKIEKKHVMAHLYRAIYRCAMGNFVGSIVDLSQVLTLTGMDPDMLIQRMSRELSVAFKNSKNQKTMDIFKKDSGAEEVVFKTEILVSYALWLSNKKWLAGMQFDAAINMHLTFHGKPSKETQKTLRRMLSIMPADMKKEKGVRESLKMFRGNL